MKIRSILKAARFAILFVAVFFSISAVPAQAESSARKGLPLEMLISPDELRQKQISGKSFLLLDARSPKHYKGGHIEGAILPLTPEYYNQEELFKQGMVSQQPNADTALAQSMSRYPKNTSIVAYCMVHCQASAALVMKLKRLGFSDLKDMEEGIEVWQQKGYPVAQ